MYQEGSIRYIADSSLQAVTLPYAGGQFSMTIVLPRDHGALAALEADLDGARLRQLFDDLDRSRPSSIELYLPRFKMELSYSLKEIMKKLGIRDAFDSERADFSAMGGDPGYLYIDNIVHKTFVEVNEKGTRAAAATSRRLRSLSANPVFRADHPFLFFVREHNTGTILFAGRVSNPQER